MHPGSGRVCGFMSKYLIYKIATTQVSHSTDSLALKNRSFHIVLDIYRADGAM